MESEIIKFIELVKEIDPGVWRILMRQVYIEIAARLCWASLWASLAIASFKLRNTFEITREKNEYRGLMYLLLLTFGVITFGLVVSSAMWLANPEFYAIRWLLQQAAP